MKVGRAANRMERCVNCIKKYSDKWGVPLMAGPRPAREEKCEKQCRSEHVPIDEARSRERAAPVFWFIALIILLLAAIIYFFLAENRRAENMLDKAYSGNYPESRDYSKTR